MAVVSSRGQILKIAGKKWRDGSRIRAVLIALWVLVPLSWAQARQRRVDARRGRGGR